MLLKLEQFCFDECNMTRHKLFVFHSNFTVQKYCSKNRRRKRFFVASNFVELVWLKEYFACDIGTISGTHAQQNKLSWDCRKQYEGKQNNGRMENKHGNKIDFCSEHAKCQIKFLAVRAAHMLRNKPISLVSTQTLKETW